jgi:hypothetical protein
MCKDLLGEVPRPSFSGLRGEPATKLGIAIPRDLNLVDSLGRNFPPKVKDSGAQLSLAASETSCLVLPRCAVLALSSQLPCSSPHLTLQQESISTLEPSKKSVDLGQSKCALVERGHIHWSLHTSHRRRVERLRAMSRSICPTNNQTSFSAQSCYNHKTTGL